MEFALQDVFAVPGLTRKSPRVCSNPLCGKVLSALNKQDLCFTCHNKLSYDKRQPASKRARL